MDIVLSIDNSESTIVGLSREQHNKLKDILSYSLDPSSAYFSGHGPRRVSLLGKRSNFPTGLLYLVEKFLLGLTHVVEDRRIRPQRPLESIFMGRLTLEPYPEQIEAVNACLSAHRGIVSATTGFGKSVTFALLIAKLKLRTLVVVPNLTLKQQLKQSFSKLFTSLDHIVIENIDSPKLKTMTDFDLLIIDEGHHVAAKTYRDLNKKAWSKIYYRFFFTATPFRSRDEERLLFESVAGKIIYRVPYDKAVEKGYIVPMEAYYYELPRTRIESQSWPEVYRRLIVDNEQRNTLIANLIANLKSNNQSVLCLVKEIKHGDALSQASGVHFASGISEDTEDLMRFFSEGKLKGLIATTGIAGEGSDTKACEYVVIAGLGKAKNSFMQQVGRAFRRWTGKETCKVIIFLDKSHKWCVQHFKAQVKILREEYGVEPIPLELPVFD